VNEKDEEVGTEDKLRAHQKGRLFPYAGMDKKLRSDWSFQSESLIAHDGKSIEATSTKLRTVLYLESLVLTCTRNGQCVRQCPPSICNLHTMRHS
jgi:hypothetical protein